MAVRRVRLATQAVDNPQLDPTERRERVVVQLGDVGRIAERPDAEPQSRAEPVILRERHDRHARGGERAGDLVRL